MAKKRERFRTLGIYLLKDNISDPAEALRPEIPVKKIQLMNGSTVIGDLYIRQGLQKPPVWASFFEEHVSITELGSVQTTSAVLLIPIENRVFALAFGHGWCLLKEGCWEERFGLKVVLNCINDKSLRSIDKETFDAIARHTRIQSTQDATTADFGIDIERDILRAATGIASKPQYGKRLTGRDSLHAQTQQKLADLPSLLSIYLRKSHDKAYRKKFPWVDQIIEVSDTHLISRLDDALIEKIKNQEADCWLAVPEIIDWSTVSGFRYSFIRGSFEYPDLHISDFLESLRTGAIVTPQYLKNHSATCINTDDQEIRRWPIYQCLHCETEFKGHTYFLSAGKWYRVDHDFVEDVNAAIRTIPIYPTRLPDYNDAAEEIYNKRVADGNQKDYALMDQKLIPIGGGHNSVEFCDLYSSAKHLIHIKRYGQSRVLSHLFAQALVSAESFLAEIEFRKKVNSILPEPFRLSDPAAPINATDFQIVLGIVSDSPGDELNLPFFSRVNLRHVQKRLSMFGFPVALSKIRVADEKAKLKKARKSGH